MALTWGTADEISIAAGFVVAVGAAVLNPANRETERVLARFADGIALGPLLMILGSPVPQLFRSDLDLLEMVLRESRVAIYVAAFNGAYRIVRGLL